MESSFKRISKNISGSFKGTKVLQDKELKKYCPTKARLVAVLRGNTSDHRYIKYH